jgi:serine/threonine-protein kinase RsbW
VADYARRLGMRDVSAIEIAVSEAVTNAVVHAYVGVPEGEVAVTAEMPEGDGLFVAVSDEGAGLVPRHDSPGLGLGLAVIAQLAASFEVHEPPGSGTTVRMHFAA